MLGTLKHASFIRGDLQNPDSLRSLVEGADAIIHCAGSVRGATQAQFDRVNVDGTRNLLDAIKVAGAPPRLLVFSSLAAREPHLSFYATSKYRAEQLLKGEADGIAWTVLRPPAVYGPGDRELLPLFRYMAHGIALVAGSPRSRFSMIYVEDLSAAVISWLRANTLSEKIYALDDGKANGYDWHELSTVVGEICGRKVRIVQPPSWLLDFPAWLNRLLARITGGSPMLTPEKLRELRHPDWVCNNAEFQQDIDWQPGVALPEGLQATPDWPGHRRRNCAA